MNDEARRKLELLAATAHVDGKVVPEELAVLRRCAEKLGVPAAELEGIVAGGAARKSLKLPAEPAERRELWRNLLEVVASDRLVAPEERKLLERLRGAFGVSEAELAAALEGIAAASAQAPAPAAAPAAPRAVAPLDLRLCLVAFLTIFAARAVVQAPSDLLRWRTWQAEREFDGTFRLPSMHGRGRDASFERGRVEVVEGYLAAAGNVWLVGDLILVAPLTFAIGGYLVGRRRPPRNPTEAFVGATLALMVYGLWHLLVSGRIGGGFVNFLGNACSCFTALAVVPAAVAGAVLGARRAGPAAPA